tara:strand:- start:479 stop:1129 length:651 start_codon:yes stop_codon:yes gene_type:complete
MSLKSAISKTINKATQKQIDRLMKLRKERKIESARTTIDSRDTPSLEEIELERKLMNKNVDVPGIGGKTAIRKSAGGENPLNDGEKNKLRNLAARVEKFADKEDMDKADTAYDAFQNYENRLIAKYGDAIQDYTADLSPNYSTGGDVKSPKKKKKEKIGIMIAVGKVKKPEMQYGGTVGGKRHMYVAGGEVKMNPGLRALQKASPEAFKKITGKSG